MKNLLTIVFILSSLNILAQEKLKVFVHSIEGYGEYENFGRASADELNKVLSSEKFRELVLNGNFKKTNGQTNQQVYEKIMLASELQGKGGSDEVVDLRLRILTKEIDGIKWMKNCEPDSWAGTIGIDGQGDGVTAICPQRLAQWANSNDKAQLAAHYAHEYMHILGYHHNGIFKRKSLVYQIGDIVESLIKEGI